MRIACLLLVAFASVSSGCSAFIGSRGNDVTVLKTKDEVRAVFGEPVTNGVEEGQSFEEYRTRRKIATFSRIYGEGYFMLLVATGGTSELVMTPIELYLMGKRTLLGQTIRVTYGATGYPCAHSLDGESLWPRGFRNRRNQGVQLDSVSAIPTATPSPAPANPGR